MVLNLKGKEIELRKFSVGEEDIILDFQDAVAGRLEDKSSFVKETREECILGLERGLILGAYMDDELIGAWSLIAFGEMEQNYGYDFGFTKEQLLKTVNIENAIVTEKARGMGLGKKVVEYAVNQMNDKYDYFGCTIALNNLASLKAMIRNGFSVRVYKLKYGQYKRYVLLRDETEENAFDEETKVVINYSEVEKIKELLANGYCACDITTDNNFIFYKKVSDCVCCR